MALENGSQAEQCDELKDLGACQTPRALRARDGPAAQGNIGLRPMLEENVVDKLRL